MSGEALYAKPVLESILDRTLVIWDADGRQGAVDLRAFDGPTLSIEVKQITNSDLRIAHSRALGTALQFHGSALLTRFWTLIPEVSPPPDYAKVASNAESILVSMEEKGMFESWRLAPEFVSVEDWSERLKVWKELRSLLGGGIAQGVEANAEFPSGFVILLGYGTVSPTDPNKFVQQIEDLLRSDSHDFKRLRKQLANSTDDERHAFIYLDPDFPTDLGGSPRHLAGALPSRPLLLPEMIHTVWMAQPGILVWRYSRITGWTDASKYA